MSTCVSLRQDDTGEGRNENRLCLGSGVHGGRSQLLEEGNWSSMEFATGVAGSRRPSYDLAAAGLAGCAQQPLLWVTLDVHRDGLVTER